ncbi:MAG: PVC-type heme-binding CxxCH protein [Aureliella sp.]
MSCFQRRNYHRLVVLCVVLCAVLCAVLKQLPNASAHDSDVHVVRWKTQQLSEQFYSEGATTADFDGDGDIDVASGPFWYEGPEFRVKHQFYAQDAFDPHGYSNNFFAYSEDFNGDGRVDILVFGFPGKDASWFENPGESERFWQRHVVLDVVDNESPTFTDLNGDGRREIVCSSGGYFGYAEVNREDPSQKWEFVRVSDKSAGGRFTHGLGVGDVNGDGRLDLLEKNGWWEQPSDLSAKPVWMKHSVAFSAGHGNAQIFADDVDRDGDQDVICSLNAHGYGLAWFENTAVSGGEIEFRQRDIMGAKPSDSPFGVCFSQLHAVEYQDIDGDGFKDIVTGKRYWAHGPSGDADPSGAPVVYWFRHTVDKSGAVDWEPHKIDDASGVGTEVHVADLNGDDRLDVVTANKKGTYVHTQILTHVTEAEAERTLPRRLDQRAKPSAEGLPSNAGLSPEEAAAAMTVPDGFHVQLAAGEPMVHQPIAMAFDHRGRLWIAEAFTYPQRAPEGQGRDRIIILEDTDSDGQFDQRIEFAKGLNLVSGLQVGFGGVWVGAAPNLLFIPDRNEDDVPDGEPEVLLDGFGYQDTHETLNSFIWGPDGWLYGCHGVFTHSRVGKPGTADEERVPLNAGVWRYHPTRHQFEVFAHGTSNPWGVDFDDSGEAFITACVIPHMYHMVPGGRYQRQAGSHFNAHTYEDIQTIADHAHYSGNIRDHAWWGRNDAVAHDDTDAAGGGHAHAGALIYLGDNWPEAYRGSILMDNIHGNRINRERLRRNGSSFIASHSPDFLFANDQWFRAINLQLGPDGSVYLIDWYDKNACHRHDTEIWDRTNGRVYRVHYGKSELRSRDLSRGSDAELVSLMASQNEWEVRMARRLLQQRAATGDDRTVATLRTALISILQSSRPVRVRLRALWTLEACGLTEESDLLELLKTRGHKSELLRSWAIRLTVNASSGRPVSESLLAAMEKLARSAKSPVVRSSLASALQKLPLDQRWGIAGALVKYADDASDKNIPLLLWYGIEPLVVDAPARAFGLAESSRIEKVRRFIYRRAASDAAATRELLVSLKNVTDVDAIRLILGAVRDSLAKQGQVRMPDRWPEIYGKLAALGDSEVSRTIQAITVKFGDRSIFPTLRSLVRDESLDLEGRVAALETLVNGEDDQLPNILIGLLGDENLRGQSIRALASFGSPEAATAILEQYARFSKLEKDDAILTLVSRTPSARQLLEAVKKRDIPYGDLNAIAVRQLEQLGDEQILRDINEVWGRVRTTPAEKLQLVATWKSKLSPNALTAADLSNGRQIYMENCGKCHRLFGAGGEIGPDITGSNRADIDYTLHNIIDPNAQIGRDYQATKILTESDRVVTGLVKEENDTAVVIQTSNEILVLDKDNILQRTLSDVSMMPEGQLEKLSDDAVRDLVAYLASPIQVPLPGAGPVFRDGDRRVAGGIEAEELVDLVSGVGDSKVSGSVQAQAMGGFPDGRWSGDSQLWWTGGKPGEAIQIPFQAPAKGRYEVFLALTKAIDYGVFEVSVNDTAGLAGIDLFDRRVVSTGPVSLGTHELAEGENRLEVSLVGSNPQAVKRFMFGLDYLYLGKESPASKEEE